MRAKALEPVKMQTRRAVPGLLVVALVCAVLATGARAAIDAPAAGRLSLEQIEAFRTKGIPDEQWPALLETFGSEDQRNAVRTLVQDQKPFPAAQLIGFLTSSKLSVRLGALDLLEDAASETFGFDPWQEEPAAGANAEALARWKSWLEKGPASSAPRPTTLDGQTFRAIATELMSGSRERAERAMQRLDAFGLAGIAHVETFLREQPMLEPAPRAALKEAEYRVALMQAVPKQAAALARDLAFGRAELQTAALALLGKAGSGALPVIAEFLSSADPLVRETATDAAFEAGKKHAVPIVIERLKTEKAESVLHAMLRGVGQYAREPAHAAAIASFLDHPSENVVITALEALGTAQSGADTAALAAKLDDPRWRVRASALEALSKRAPGALQDKIAQRLDDPDQFVRTTAVGALAHAPAQGAQALLIDRFQKQDDLKPAILRVLFSREKAMPAKVWESLEKAPPEVILQCLEAFEDRDDHEGKRIPQAARFARHANRDVSATALRLLAGRGRHPALLLEALKSGDAVKQDAVLDQLQLPPGFLSATPGGSSPATQTAAGAPPNPLLNRLYQAIAGSSRTGSSTAAAPTAEAKIQPAEMRSVLEVFLRKGTPRQRFRAAVVLVSQGDLEAARWLLAGFETLSSLDRRAVAAALKSVADWSPAPLGELALRVLRDSADDVREQAVEAWIDASRPQRLAGLLAELIRPGSQLHPVDIYTWELDRIMQAAGARAVILSWSRKLLEDATAPDVPKVLAVMLLARSGQTREVPLEPLLTAPSPWVRRAVYRALGLAAAQTRLETLLRDENALVRGALPFLAAPENGGWRHWFDDAHNVADYEDYNRQSFSSGRSLGPWAKGEDRKKAIVNEETFAALEKLTRDPSEYVRFEAQFALLRLGRPIDPLTLAGLSVSQAPDTMARERIGSFLQKNYARLGKAYGVLVPLSKHIDESELPKLLKHFGIEGANAFTSFAALAQLAPVAPPASDNTIVAAPATPVRATLRPFRAIFFYKAGCRDCDRARDMLKKHAPDFPTLAIDERNIDQPREALLNETLAARFDLKETLHQVTPAVFTQAGPLVREEITFPRLGDLLRKAQALPPEESWARAAAVETAGAEQTIARRYDALSFGVVATAGLLDGINPCAFATIIFLLSYLQVARRAPREILAVGAAFILAVFLSYFAVGLGLAQVLAKIAALRVAGTVLNYVLAAFALVIALLSLRDAQLAARGELSEMTLQLPGILKEQIRSVIRTGTRASHFVAAAFAAGVVISFLELACTGQVYLPTILYMLRSGRTSAVLHLTVYNVAFIAPLILVFLLAWSGLKSDALVRFQKERTALVKVLTAILFLLLAAFLLFGYTLLPRLPLR